MISVTTHHSSARGSRVTGAKRTTRRERACGQVLEPSAGSSQQTVPQFGGLNGPTAHAGDRTRADPPPQAHIDVQARASRTLPRDAAGASSASRANDDRTDHDRRDVKHGGRVGSRSARGAPHPPSTPSAFRHMPAGNAASAAHRPPHARERGSAAETTSTMIYEPTPTWFGTKRGDDRVRTGQTTASRGRAIVRTRTGFHVATYSRRTRWSSRVARDLETVSVSMPAGEGRQTRPSRGQSGTVVASVTSLCDNKSRARPGTVTRVGVLPLLA